MERVILTTGGTGGHIFPAIALAEEIRKRNPGVTLLFMGGEYGPEADLAAKAGLDFFGLPVRGVMGRGLAGLVAAVGMARGIARALRVIRKVRPEVVVGFGGYAAFAGVLAGSLAGSATAIHEQNAFPGMTNRLLARRVDRVFLSMPDASGVFDAGKTVLVGNLVRAGIVALHEKKRALRAGAVGDGTRSCQGGFDAPSPFGRTAGQAPAAGQEPGPPEDAKERAPRLLVMGGSLGARAVNDGMVAVIEQLLDAGVEIWHQTGKTDHERVRAAYREANAEHVRVEPFIADMPRAYEWADLVFCRAGASSLAEITAVGLPALLVPFPHATHDHQRHNARFLEEQGGAVVLEQARFTGKTAEPDSLAQTLLSLLRDTERLRQMADRSFASGRPYAAGAMADELEALLASSQV